MSSPDSRWQAVLERSSTCEFLYAVTTTGVYCRPNCPARRPRRENVRFFASPQEARAAGFRPCQRCRPGQVAPRSRAVEQACRLLEEEPRDLQELAHLVGLSPSHLHRCFKSLLGVTPRAYAQAVRARRLQAELARPGSVTRAIYEAGYHSSSRLPLGMSPTAWRQGGAGQEIRFVVAPCWLGFVLIGVSPRGVCRIALGDAPEPLRAEFLQSFPTALESPELKALVPDLEEPSGDLPLDIQGTAFQQRVWQALCQIPRGQTRTYRQVAEALGQPTAVRAVAAACAANPLALLIPCHRVIRGDGSLAGFRWGLERKARLLEREQP